MATVGIFVYRKRRRSSSSHDRVDLLADGMTLTYSPVPTNPPPYVVPVDFPGATGELKGPYDPYTAQWGSVNKKQPQP